MEHTCHAQGCAEEVQPKLFMCRRHWYALPSSIRTAIWCAYRPGQEIDKQPSEEYLVIAEQAVTWLAERG